jgi:hypothetical protein
MKNLSEDVNGFGIPIQEAAEIPLTMSALNRIIKWTTSRYNPDTKDFVLRKAYKILYSGQGSQIFRSGTYTETPGTVYYPDYLIDGEARAIHAGTDNGDKGFEKEESWFFTLPTSEKVRWKPQRIRGKLKRVQRDYAYIKGLELMAQVLGGKASWEVRKFTNNEVLARGDAESLEAAKTAAEEAAKEI